MNTQELLEKLDAEINELLDQQTKYNQKLVELEEKITDRQNTRHAIESLAGIRRKNGSSRNVRTGETGKRKTAESYLKEVLEERGEPMPLKEIVSEVAKRGYRFKGDDPNAIGLSLGHVLRKKDIFISPQRGYFALKSE